MNTAEKAGKSGIHRAFSVAALSLLYFLAGGISQASAKDLRIALVLDKGGKDDKSFNSAAYKGAMKAKDELHAFLKYVEATDENAFESLLRSFAQKDFDIIFAIGVTQADAVRKVAAQFPDKHFALVDAEVKAPNVRSIVFEEHQGSYLVGAAAALTSKSGKVGFIGGMDIPLIRRFQLGYEAGVKKINPKAQVVSNYIGITGDAWNNPAKSKELAASQYDAGVDVVFAVAGASNSGVFDEAEEKGKFAIGVDSNQNWIKPGHILTSMLKRVDVAVFTTAQEAQAGKFVAGTQHYGLDSQGVDFAVDQYNDKILPAASRKKLDAIKADIISGKIKVPDYYSKK
jgi:basic membrane protein A